MKTHEISIRVSDDRFKQIINDLYETDRNEKKHIVEIHPLGAEKMEVNDFLWLTVETDTTEERLYVRVKKILAKGVYRKGAGTQVEVGPIGPFDCTD